jgi:outer membrane protein
MLAGDRGREQGGVMMSRAGVSRVSCTGASLGLLLCASQALAQPVPEVVGLEDCIRLALAARSTVAAARQQAEIAALEVDRAKAALRPQAYVTGAFTQASEVAEGSDVPDFVALNGHREYLGVATTTQEIDISGRLRASRDRARADQAASAASLGIAQRDLRSAVARSYFRALLTRHLAAAAREALAESKAFDARTKLLFAGGEVARADVVKAEGQTAALEQSVLAADLDSEVAMHELLAFWTTDVTEPLRLRDDLDGTLPSPPPPPSDKSGAEPFRLRPELLRWGAERDSFLAEARRAHAERLPQASVTFQYGIDSLRFDWTDRGYALFANIDIPIFDWGKGKKAARQFQLQADALDTTREVETRTFSKEYQDALSRVRLVHAQLASSRAQVSLSEENLRLARVRYDGGEGLALDVVGAQTQLVQARNNNYSTIARYLESHLDLEVASGT